jgi:capsular exopolysaccharide synthesis family protein
LTTGGNLADLILPTSVPHLSILPSGPVPPNPSELISSNKMKELLVKLQGLYDYVLIDSPPLVTVTDPIILSTLVDGVILVCKSGKTKTDVLRRAYHDLATINAKILGVVLNDFNMRRDGYQDYYYYYRYQYDYSERATGTNG